MILRRAASASVLAISFALALTACVGQPSSTPTSTSTPAATPAPTPTPTATATSAPPSAAVTCEDITNAQFDEILRQNTWVVWQTNDEPYGARPFDDFPNGSPDGMVLCRAGKGKDVATDNVLDVAWTPLDPETAVAAMQALEASGYQRIEAPEGVYLAMPGVDGGWQDDEGFADAYLFTADDVFWVAFKSDLTFVKAPDESE